MMFYSNFIPSTKAIDIGDGITYRLHKHWGMNIYAGEGLFVIPGTQDGSGCLKGDPTQHWNATCSRPRVVLQRIYQKDTKQVSSVLSYPHGIAIEKDYFWEIYPAHGGDVERFFDEDEMEDAVRRVLNEDQKA